MKFRVWDNVVEKIELKGNESEIRRFFFEDTWKCEFTNDMDEESGYGFSTKSKIDAIWQAVIQFIQWYNQNKP